MGEMKNAANFRMYLNGQLASFAKELGDAPNVRIIDDPMTATVANTSTPTTVPSSAKTKDAPAKNAAPKSEVLQRANRTVCSFWAK